MRYDVLRFERIRTCRVDRDLSQKEVAAAFNIAPNTLAQYELGLRNIPNGILIAMARYYKTSVDYLLGLTDNPKPYGRSK